MNVAVVGAAGYAGGELLRLLHQHPDLRDVVATSRSRGGTAIAAAHPALATVTDARFSDAAPSEIARGRDVVFLCLEHGESSRVAGEVFAARPGLVVDLAADFRVRDRVLYERYYGAHGSATAWPTCWATGFEARGPSPRRAASRPRRSWRSIRWLARGSTSRLPCSP